MSISLTDSKNWSGQLNGVTSLFNGKSLTLATSDLATIWNKPLSSASFKGLGPGTIKFSGNTPLPFGGTTLTVTASQGASLGGQVGGDFACSSGEFEDALSLGTKACLWLKLSGNTGVGVSGSFSGFGIGINANSYAEYRFAQIVSPDASGQFCTLAAGLDELFQHLSPPRDLDELLKAPTDSVFESDCGGSVTVKASYSIPSATIPLATTSVPVLKDKLCVQANASLGVSGSFGISGALVFRVYKMSATVARFQIFKKRGTSVSVSFDASAGITGGVGGQDFIDAIFKAITPDVSSLKVVASDPKLCDQIKDVVQEAVAGHLAASLNMEASVSSSTSHLFSVDVDLQLANGAADMRDSVNALFRGDWTLATQHNSLCVKDWSDTLEKVTKSERAFRLHLLNVFSAVSIADFLTSVKVLRTPDGVVFTDNNTASQIQATGNIAEPKSLSNVLAKALESTLVFKSVNASPVLAELTISGQCFQYEQNGSRDDLVEIACLSESLDCPLTIAQPATIRVGVVKFEASTKFDSMASDACFIGPAPDYRPKEEPEYKRHALDAITLLYPAKSLYHEAASDDILWASLDGAGNLSAITQNAYVQSFLTRHGIHTDMPGMPSPATNDLYSLWYTVAYWSEAMANYAELLQKAKKLAAQLTPGDAQKVRDIQDLMQQLANAMRKAQNLENGFIDARAQFGLAALYLSSGKRSANQVALTWNGLNMAANNQALGAAGSS